MMIVVVVTKYGLVFLEHRCFSSMFPSMPKGEIVSMNADDITMGVYCHVVFMTMFVIDFNIVVSLRGLKK